jgi:predicted AAA+ superfamily ATPase
VDLALRDTIFDFGKGTAFYLNGDDIPSSDLLEAEILKLVSSYSKVAKVKRLFIDEITAIDSWEKVIKRLWDRGELRDILVVTTGSKATDLRRGSENFLAGKED